MVVLCYFVVLDLKELLGLRDELTDCFVTVKLFPLLAIMLDFLVELVTFLVLVTGPVVDVIVLVMVLVTPP